MALSDVRWSKWLVLVLIAAGSPFACDRSGPTWPLTALLSAEPGDGFAQIWWPEPNETDVLVYVIHVDGAERGRVTRGSTSYIVDELDDGQTYAVTVTAFDEHGNPSEPLRRGVTSLDRSPPVWPDGASVHSMTVAVLSPNLHRIHLSWPNAPDAVRYRVFRDGVEVGSVEDAEYMGELSPLSNETPFEVRAYDREENESNGITAFGPVALPATSR